MTLSGMLLEILSVSLPMTVLILLLCVFSRFFGQRFTAKCRYIVWTLVLLRLCLPVGIVQVPSLVQVYLDPAPESAETEDAPSDRSAPTLIWSVKSEDGPLRPGVTYDVPDPVALYIDETDQKKYEEIFEEAVRAIVTGNELPEGAETEPGSVPEPTGESETETSPVQETVNTPEPSLPEQKQDGEPVELPSPPSPLTVLGAVWFVGAAGYLLFHIVSYRGCIRRLKSSCTDAPADVLRIGGQLCTKYRIRRLPDIRMSRDVRSPMLCGYFRPCILLPDMDFTPNQTVGILAHELTHHRRHDLWIKFACVLGCALHWFNPAVHFAASRCQREMELSCDEEVLAGLDEDARRSYGNVMLAVMRNSHGGNGKLSRKNTALTTRFDPKKKAVRERFLNIMDMSKKKQGFAVVLAAGVLCALAGMVFAYDAEAPAEDENTIKVNDNVSIHIGLGTPGKYEEINPDETDDAETEEISEPVEELYICGGLEIPVPAEMVEYVKVYEDADENTFISIYHTASLTDSTVDPESGDGWLFSIGRHDYDSLVNDRNNQGWLEYFAAEPDNSWFYYVASPTDVRWDPTDEEAAAEYAELSKMKTTVAERVLADNGLVPFTGSDVPETVRLNKERTYPSPDYLSRLEYSETYGWLLRGEGAGTNGIALGDSTKTAEIWAEWVSDTCCRLSVDGNVIDLYRKDAGWTTEDSAFDLAFENNLPVWVKKADSTDTGDILRKASYGMLKPDEFLAETQIRAKFIKRTNALVEPYRSGEAYVPDGAVFPDEITWDSFTVTADESDDYDYLITLPLGEFYMTIEAEIALSETGIYSLSLSGEEFHLTDPIIAEEGSLRDLLESLMSKNRTDYSAEIHIPDADDAVLSIRVEGEGRDPHDLKDVLCTSFTAKGQTLRFEEPLDLWGAWGVEVFAAENTVVLMQRFTSYSGNSYVITPKYTYEYHPGAFSLILYEENNDLRYRHSSTALCDAALRTGDEPSASLLGIATSRDNFCYERGDVTLNGGKLVFYEADEYYTIDDAFDLDAEFEKLWKSETYPTIDALFLYNGERYGTMYDYPAPDETPLPETVKADSLYKKVEAVGTYTSEYRCMVSADSSYGNKVSMDIRIPQLTFITPAVTEWNNEIYSRIREECDPLLIEYQTGCSDRYVTVTYEEIIHDGVVSIPITFAEGEKNTYGSNTETAARAEVYHYDIQADRFLTNEEYLLRITDGTVDYETLLASLNEQEFNRVLNEPHAHLLPGHEVGDFTADDLYGIVPSELDENGFDVYLPKDVRYDSSSDKLPVAAVHWREYPVFTVEEGYTITYRLFRTTGGYQMMTYINDTRDLALEEENQSQRLTSAIVYPGKQFDLTYSFLTATLPQAKITYLNSKGEPAERTTAYGSHASAAYYFEKYLDGTYDMKTLIENSVMVQNAASSFIRDIRNAYENGEKPFESAPDFPDGIAVPTRFTTEDVVTCYAETGDPAHPFKFAVPLDDNNNWTMDVYWTITEDGEMTAEMIEFHQ